MQSTAERVSKTNVSFGVKLVWSVSQLIGALAVSKRTAEFLRTLIVHNRYPDAISLLQDVKKMGSQIQEAKPTGVSVVRPQMMQFV